MSMTIKKSSHPFIKGALVLTAAGLITRILGFFYKIFLVSLIGAEGIGLYQMVFPLYMLCVSLASSGISTAISRFTAERLPVEGPGKARSLFLTGLAMALSFSLLIALPLYVLAKPAAVWYLGEERCLPLLRIMALSIPFEVLHGCVNAYMIGQKKTGFPALSQLLEQSVRIGATWLLYQVFISRGLSPSPSLAAGGLLTAEGFTALLSVSLLAFRREKRPLARRLPSHPAFFENVRLIGRMALPVTGNRLMLNLLQSWEAALIPSRLELFYHSTSSALSAYGVFTGMAMPLVMLPCTITGSFSLMLLPSVSEAHALGDGRKIEETVRSSLALCVFMGVLSTAGFLCFGSSLGLLLYGDARVGGYLTTLAWICPFLYLTTTVSSILHGLGKTSHVFRHNLAGLAVRLAFTWFFVPFFGIQGCLWGLLASQLLTALLGIRSLGGSVSVSFSSMESILVPGLVSLAGTGLLKLLQRLLPVLAGRDSWICLFLSAGIWGCLVLPVSLAALKRIRRPSHAF